MRRAKLVVASSLNEFSERVRVVPEFGDPNIQELFVRYMESATSKAYGQMRKEEGIKALKMRLLTNEILFIDEKIGEFERGGRLDLKTIYSRIIFTATE